MIVECNQCHAKFRLDDTKITEKGVKVRCSKCKHVFTVNKENAAQYGKTDGAAPAPSPPKAAPKPAPPPAEPSFVPPPKPQEEAPKEESSSGFEFKDEPEPPAPDSQGFDDGLGDLSFGDENPAESEPSAPPPAPDMDFGDFPLNDEKPQTAAAPAPEPAGGEMDDFGDFDFDDDISAESDSSSAPAPEPPPPAPSAEPPAQDTFGDMPDFSASEPEPSLAQPSAPADSGGLSDDFGGDDFGGGDFDLGSTPAPTSPAAPPPASPPPPSGGGNLDEFGEISFDDAGSQGAPPPPATPSAPPAGQAGGPAEFGDIELDTGGGGRTMDEFKKTSGGAEDSYAFNMGTMDDSESDIPASSQPHEETRAPAAAPVERPRPQSTREISTSSGKGGKKIVVVIIVLALLGGGGFLFNKKMTEKGIKFGDLNVDKIKELIGLKKKEVLTNKWEIKVRGFYSIERPDEETLWVMRGTITNFFTNDKSTILVEGAIRDGNTVRKSRSIVANKIEDAQLKKFPMEKILETLMNTNVQDENLEPFFLRSGKTADFVIVFDNVESEKPPTPELPDEKWVVNSVNL